MKDSNLLYLILARYVTYAGVFIISVIMIGNNLTEIMFFSALFFMVVLNSLIRVRRFESKPVWFICSVLVEIVAIWYLQNDFNSIAFIDLYIITTDVYLLLKMNLALPTSVAIFAGLLTSEWPKSVDLRDLQGQLISATMSLSLMLFFAAAAYVVRLELNKRLEIQSLNAKLHESWNQLEETNRKLTEYARKVEDIAVVSERNRLAGEIHDELGHNLTALILEIGICGKLIDRDIDKTKAELLKASELAKNALSDVRGYISSIKPSNIEGLTGVRALSELISAFQESTGISVRFAVSEQQYRLSPSVDVTVYCAVQEVLTNSAKHGQANTVLIDLRFKERMVELLIKDNGRGCNQLVKGVGLKTMEERIGTLGGRTDFSCNDGFAIKAAIPVGGS